MKFENSRALKGWSRRIRYSWKNDQLEQRGHLEIFQRMPDRDKTSIAGEPEYLLRLGLCRPRDYYPAITEVQPIFHSLHRIRISPFAPAIWIFDAPNSFLVLDTGNTSCVLKWNANAPKGWENLDSLIENLHHLAEKYAGPNWASEEDWGRRIVTFLD